MINDYQPILRLPLNLLLHSLSSTPHEHFIELCFSLFIILNIFFLLSMFVYRLSRR